MILTTNNLFRLKTLTRISFLFTLYNSSLVGNSASSFLAIYYPVGCREFCLFYVISLSYITIFFVFPLKRNQCDCIFSTMTTLQSVITSSGYHYKRASQVSKWLQAANNTKLHRKLKVIVSTQYSPRQIINANEQLMMICICDQVLATVKIQMPLKCLRLIIRVSRILRNLQTT